MQHVTLADPIYSHMHELRRGTYIVVVRFRSLLQPTSSDDRPPIASHRCFILSFDIFHLTNDENEMWLEDVSIKPDEEEQWATSIYNQVKKKRVRGKNGLNFFIWATISFWAPMLTWGSSQTSSSTLLV